MEDQDSILNEFLERIRNLEKRNEQLRLDVDKKKNELKELEKVPKKDNEKDKKEEEKNKNKKPLIPSEEEDKIIGERFLFDIKNIKLNAYELEKNIQEVIIEYISQEQFNNLYIMGDFTKWELRSMKKNKDIFSYKLILLKGFKYFYSFQAGDQILIDYNNLYQENPKTSQIQNYIDLSRNNEESPQFDFQNDMNILHNAQKNYFLSKLSMNEEQLKFLEKFKRHIVTSKKINEEKNSDYNQISNSIYAYYDQQFKLIQPYETQTKLINLKLFFKNKIFAHYQQDVNVKDKQYKYFFKIINLTESFCFQCIKLYDDNNIKINMNYYDSIKYYYSIYLDMISIEPIDPTSKLYHLLSTEESEKIMNEYNSNKNNVLKAYFKSLKNLQNNQNNSNQIQNQNFLGIRTYMRNYGSILVTPHRVEPEGINLNDYEYQYSLNKITKVRNKKEGSYIEFVAVDEEAEKAKKPFRYKIYYCIKNNKINILHCHVLDKDLRNIKINIKDIDKNVDPHTLKKNEEYIKNNELLLLIVESTPKKLYYKGKKVKMDAIKMEENKLYLLLSSNPDSIFNKMYVTTKNLENKLNYDLLEQCSEFSYSFDNIPNGVDVQVTYDNAKNYVVEQMMLAVSPCLLTKLSTYEENNLKQKKVNELDIKNLNEMDKYFMITQKMIEIKKNKKENIDKMDQKEKETIYNNLKEYKESMVIILNYIEANEMWETIDEAVNLAAEIEELIDLYKNK